MDLSQYLAEDTIAGLATAMGGPVAIVRVSGPRAGAALKAIAGLNLEAGRARLADLRTQEQNLLDSALVVTFVSPQSFTGEDVVEFQIHGSTLVSERLMTELARHGIRQALPGEFSFRAVRNGRMSLLQALGVRDLLAAASERGIELAVQKARGELDSRCNELRESLMEVAARAEIGIDFSDQDAGAFSLKELQVQLQPSIELLRQLEGTFARGRLLQEGIRIALGGPPNAGKSSLFNALVGQSAAIVHSQAGTTRDVIERRVRLNDGAATFSVTLLDTAGLRDASDAVEKEGVARAEATLRNAEIVLWCEAPDAFQPAPVQSNILRVQTKADLALPSSGALAVSTQTGAGLAELEKAIAHRCAELTGTPRAELVLTTEAERAATECAREAIERATQATGLEFLASDVRFALKALGPVIGGVNAEDVLGQVFSKFCIGK